MSARGVRQSEQLSELLEPLGIRQVFSSPFVRCLETVTPFTSKGKIQVIVNEDLRERLVAKKLIDGFYEVWRRSWEDFDFALPSCETSAKAQQRFVKAVKAITEEHAPNPIAISTHGNVIGLFLNWVDNSVGRKETEQLKNPDVVRVVRRDDKFTWDRNFRLRGLETITTDHGETPVERDE